jgi:tetratricopeptide (TPR) repeat protein
MQADHSLASFIQPIGFLKFCTLARDRGEEKLLEFFHVVKVDWPKPDLAAREQPLATSADDRLIVLSSWMMVLGTIRVLCTFADLMSAFLNSARFASISRPMLVQYFDEHQPILAMTVAWPLLIGILLRRKRWPELLPAAGIAFLILAAGGMLAIIAEWNRARGGGITVGSFQLTRRALLNPTISDVALGLLGTCQLVLEFATAFRAFQLAHEFRGSRGASREPDRPRDARRSRCGRLAIYASIGFLVLMVRLPVWSTYLEVINGSTLIREFVLRSDINRINAPPRTARTSANPIQMKDLQTLIQSGGGPELAGHYLEARKAFERIILRAEKDPTTIHTPAAKAAIAQAENNLSWLLSTCPAVELRDPPEAVAHAKRATLLAPEQGNYWNSLGVAYFRNGQWEEAAQTLNHAMQLRDNGDSFDWFFLAMIEMKIGKRDRAQDWYQKAVSWYQLARPNDHELRRFHLEAANALGVSAPSQRLESKSRGGRR